jgi:hypothetical protein
MFTNELRSLVFVVDERGPRGIEGKNSELKPHRSKTDALLKELINYEMSVAWRKNTELN